MLVTPSVIGIAVHGSTRADRRIAEWLFLLTFLAYAWFHAGGGWHQNAQFDLTRAMVERHTFVIDAYANNTGDVSHYGGHVYANKAPGLSWLAAIPYTALHAFESSPDDPAILTLNHYVATLFCVALLGALIPALLYLVARRRGIEARWAVVVALTVALATQLFPYATFLIFAVPSGALMLVALVAQRRALAGFAAGLAMAMNYLCAPALLFAFVAPRRLRFFAGAALPLAAVAAYQKICFGSFLRTSVATYDPRFVSQHAWFGVINPPSLEALIGITVSPYRGLFFFAPVLIMAIAGLVRCERGEKIAIAGISLVFLAVNVTFNGWEGGFGIGARYLVPLIPLWGIALFHARPRWLVIALAAISFAINFTATAVDPQPSATIPRPLTQYLIPLLVRGHFAPDVPITPPWSAATFTGHTSVNRMTYDEAVVFQRHPPGSPEAEWASFNMGETLFGPGDARSLIPIVLLIAIAAATVATRAIRES